MREEIVYRDAPVHQMNKLIVRVQEQDRYKAQKKRCFDVLELEN